MATAASALRVICSASMSMRISLPASARAWPKSSVSVSPSSVPIASTTSAACNASITGGSGRLLPRLNGWAGGSTPLALMVSATGAPRRSTSARAASAAPAVPPPSTTKGDFASRSSAAARAMASGSGPGRLRVR